MTATATDATQHQGYYCQICEEAQATSVAFYTAPAEESLGVDAFDTDSALCPDCLESLKSPEWAEMGYRFHFATPFSDEYQPDLGAPLWPYPGD